MNTIMTTPDVKLFVTAVREHLGDLTEQEREELTGGLEGDLGDFVEERGVEALPEPADYARELRAAAGFTPEAVAARRRPQALAARVEAVLDAAGERWAHFAGGLPGHPWELSVALRPVWWVLRAWVAVQLVDLLWGSGGYNYGLSPVPSLMGWGLPLLAIVVLGSVLIGAGRLWPGPGRGRLGGRLLLLALNVLAIAVTPVTLDSLYTPAKAEAWSGGDAGNDPRSYQRGYDEASESFKRSGMYVDGHWVSNIYPYDAAGRPMVGVQLFDQAGRAVTVKPQTECVYSDAEQPVDQGRVYYPWTTAAGQVRNVFPVPSRVQGPDTPDPDPTAFTGSHHPGVGRFPLTRVPAASLPGLRVSTADTPANAYLRGASPKGPTNPIDTGC